MIPLPKLYGTLIRPVPLTVAGCLVVVLLATLPLMAGPPQEDGLPDLAKFIGRFHPMVLHLPIGMLLMVFALEARRVLSKGKSAGASQLAMFLAAASAVVAVLLGFTLYYSMPGDYDRELGQRHLNGGLIFACGTVAAFLAKVWVDAAGGRRAWTYWTLLLGSTAVMGIASHDGASLTHGKDYLTQYAPNPVRQAMGLPVKEGKPGNATPGDAKEPGEQVVYTDVIAPIFEQKCYACHNAEKQKGKFRMDEYDLLVKGGKEGEGLVHGQSAESPIIKRIELPEDDDEHMPPEGKKGLEPHEVQLVKWWIDRGASKDAKLADLQASDDIKAALAKIVPADVLAKQKTAAGQAAKDAVAKRDSVKAEVERLRKEFPAALNYESQSTSGVVFTAASLRKGFDDEDLAKLGPVMPAIVSLDLTASTVTDKGAALLKGASELKSLRLSETGVTDASIEVLAGLPKLESLNLYGTQVTNSGIIKLAGLAQLKRLYLWQTKVDAGGMRALKAKLPGCEIVMGM